MILKLSPLKKNPVSTITSWTPFCSFYSINILLTIPTSAAIRTEQQVSVEAHLTVALPQRHSKIPISNQTLGKKFAVPLNQPPTVTCLLISSSVGAFLCRFRNKFFNRDGRVGDIKGAGRWTFSRKTMIDFFNDFFTWRNGTTQRSHQDFPADAHSWHLLARIKLPFKLEITF